MDSVAWIGGDGKLSLSGESGPVPWWSFTKTVLAVAALRLVENDRLKLHEPIPGESFTLAHLLRHESGLPDYGSLPRYHEDVAAGRPPWPVEFLLEQAEARRLRFEPGKGWAYSNLGYLRVKERIESASGLPLGEALRRLVFSPLGLSTARIAAVPGDLSGVQMGDVRGYHPGWVYHGLATGTTEDAARLVRALRTGGLLKPETFAAMIERRSLPEHRNAVFADPAYGLGLMLNAESPLDHPLGHRGEGPGSSIAVYASGKASCAFWTLPLPNPDGVADRVFRQLGAS